MGALRHDTCRSVLSVILLLFSFFVCKTTVVSQDGSNAAQSSNGTIRFRNETRFMVDIIRGSGGIDVCTILPHESITVPNNFTNTEQYFPRFTIPLTNSYALTGMRARDKDFYYQMSSTAGMQEVIITTPDAIDDRNSYIVITNNSNTGGISLLVNAAFKLALYPDAARTINSKTQAVYSINPNETNVLQLNPGNIEIEHILFKPGYVYYFTTDGKQVSLTDDRPLVKIGEPVSAVIEVRGDTLTSAEQRTLQQAVQQGIQKYNVPVQKGMVFNIDFTVQNQFDSFLNREMLSCEISIELVQNGVSLRLEKTDTPIIVPAANRRGAMAQAERFLRDCEDFYRNITH